MKTSHFHTFHFGTNIGLLLNIMDKQVNKYSMKKSVMIICGVLLNFVLLTNNNYAHESTEYLL